MWDRGVKGRAAHRAQRIAHNLCLFGPDAQGTVQAREITYWAGYGDVEQFRKTLWGHAYHRGLGLQGKAVVLGNGAAWIDGFADLYCLGGVRIVD